MAATDRRATREAKEAAAAPPAPTSSVVAFLHHAADDDARHGFPLDATQLIEALKVARTSLEGMLAREASLRRRTAEAVERDVALRQALCIARAAAAWTPSSYSAEKVNTQVDAMRHHYEALLVAVRDDAAAACEKASRNAASYKKVRRRLEAEQAAVVAAEDRAQRLANTLSQMALRKGMRAGYDPTDGVDFDAVE